MRAIVANAQTKTAGTTTTNRVTECKAGSKGDAAENPTACTSCAGLLGHGLGHRVGHGVGQGAGSLPRLGCWVIARVI